MNGGNLLQQQLLLLGKRLFNNCYEGLHIEEERDLEKHYN